VSEPRPLQPLVKVAFGSVPKAGGTYTFYRNLRPELRKLGIDLRCVSVGYTEACLYRTDFADEGCELLAPRQRLVKKQSQAFVQWCEREHIDIVIGVNSRAILSALPHLPARVQVIARCASAFDHGYKITLAARDRLAAIVALTPRLQRDLETDYGADSSIMHLIPNGISPAAFQPGAHTPRAGEGSLSLGFLGRLEHNQKGVLHLVDIVQQLNQRNVNFTLRIAGEGVQRAQLERQLQQEIGAGTVSFLGPLTPTEVPEFLSSIDVFVFPSHFEGCPNALLEALMAGCVPVAWILAGITDFIVQEGETGFLADRGDVKTIAAAIEHLAQNRDELQRMSEAAARSARDRFTNNKSAEAYAELFRQVVQTPVTPATVTPWSEFTVDENFSYGLRDWMPHRMRLGMLRLLGRSAQ
jgi:glycosyltransferase involved in cell wall biosynthesis